MTNHARSDVQPYDRANLWKHRMHWRCLDKLPIKSGMVTMRHNSEVVIKRQLFPNQRLSRLLFLMQLASKNLPDSNPSKRGFVEHCKCTRIDDKPLVKYLQEFMERYPNHKRDTVLDPAPEPNEPKTLDEVCKLLNYQRDHSSTSDKLFLSSDRCLFKGSLGQAIRTASAAAAKDLESVPDVDCASEGSTDIVTEMMQEDDEIIEVWEERTKGVPPNVAVKIEPGLENSTTESEVSNPEAVTVKKRRIHEIDCGAGIVVRVERPDGYFLEDGTETTGTQTDRSEWIKPVHLMTTEEVFQVVQEACLYVYKSLGGTGYREKMLQKAVQQCLALKYNIPSMPETHQSFKHSFFHIDSGELDLQIGKHWFFEMKLHTMNESDVKQLDRYVKAALTRGEDIKGAVLIHFRKDGTIKWNSRDIELIKNASPEDYDLAV